MRDRAKQKLYSEIKIHKSVKDKNVAEFKHFFEDQFDVFMIMELCSNGPLDALLKARKRLT